VDYMYAKFNCPTFRTLEGVGEQKKCNEEKEIITRRRLCFNGMKHHERV